MGQEPRCPRCEGSMEEGFILEYQSGGAHTTKWIEGKPKFGWLGIKLR
jgi:hypothetical protein